MRDRPLDEMDLKMQESRALVTGCYLALGILAFFTGTLPGEPVQLLAALAVMPASALASLWLLGRRGSARLRLTSAAVTAFGLVLDGLLATWVIYWTGGVESPCLPFYLTAVLAASFRFGPKGTALASLQAGAGWILVAILDPGNHARDSSWGLLALRIVIPFAAAGFAIRALHRQQDRYRREKTTRRQLERAHRELEKAYTDLEEAQDRLLHAEKLATIGRLVANVAHEINNPISFVYGNLVHLHAYVGRLKEILFFDDALPLSPQDRSRREALKESLEYTYLLEDLDRAIEGSRKGAERIRKIVEALLKGARPGRNRFHRVDLVEIVENVLREREGSAAFRLRIVREYAVASAAVEGDPDELSRLFENLLDNAAHASGPAGTIRVRISTGNRGPCGSRLLLVEVEDDGTGIPPENLNRVFEPFFTTKEVGKGTGLGLSIAYSIARRHGGQIELANRAEGGAVARVSLPAPSQPEESVLSFSFCG